MKTIRGEHMNIEDLRSGNESFIVIGLAEVPRGYPEGVRMAYGYDFLLGQYRVIFLDEKAFKQMRAYGFGYRDGSVYNPYSGEQFNKDVLLIFKVKRVMKTIYFACQNREIRQVSKEDREKLKNKYKILLIEGKPILNLESSQLGIKGVYKEAQKAASLMNMGVELEIDKSSRLILNKCISREPMIDIPIGVEIIKEGAISNLVVAKTLCLPNTVKEIESKAISNCKHLSSIRGYMNKRTAKVAKDFVVNCNELKEVTIDIH